jgi:branched-subunit amino acid transport protein
MNFEGLIAGVCTFLIIGLFHPIVIKAEYYWGVRCWWIFLLVGIGAAVTSLLIKNLMISTLLGVFAFSSFWSIHELFEQRERVRKGWFPKNPKRKERS